MIHRQLTLTKKKKKLNILQKPSVFHLLKKTKKKHVEVSSEAPERLRERKDRGLPLSNQSVSRDGKIELFRR